MTVAGKNRDKQWDEKDTTSDRPLMPLIDKSSKFIRKTVRERDDDCPPVVTESRITINEIVEAQPPIRQEDGKVIIPVVKEKMVLVKKIVVTEEIEITIEENDDEDC